MNDFLHAAEKHEPSTLDNLMEGFQIIRQSRFSRKELLGKTMMERYPGIEDTELFGVLQHCMKERTTATFDNQFTFPDGSSGYFELRIEPVPEGLFILSLDVTDKQKAEQVKSEYIRGLEEMVYMTSHQLRQPITNMAGLLSLLKDAKTLPEDFSKILAFMEESIADLDHFTENLTVFINELQKSIRQSKKKSGI